MKAGIQSSRIVIGLFIAGVLFLLSACATTGTSQAGMENIVKGEYLVKLNDSADKSDIEKTFSKYKIEWVKFIGGTLYKFKVDKDPGYETLKQVAEKSGKFEYIDPNYTPVVIPPKTSK